ncbi:MAG: sigma-54-dependent transcriptional regulator [Planctomycetota bacterium]|jgi:DNA-binding NtrC family response regulator
MARTRILVVDDEEGMLEVCAATLKKLPDAAISLERDGRSAAKRLTAESFDLLIADIRMPGLSGVEVLRSARQHDPNLAVLMITAFPSVDTAVQSMKLGAADYITKPFLPEDLLATARRLLEAKQLREENRLLRRQMDRTYTIGEIVGKSAAMQSVFDTIKRVAETDVDLLIEGETGTGKELVARCTHQRSNRRGHRFVPVDCGAIPEDLLESELFGHERGAFTGAHTKSMGLLEFAHRGTFFLDEIGELPVRLQVKLLRSLQERRLRRVGGKEEIEVDVRVISATSRNLEEEVRHQRFRADLYYRINVARIAVPSLRERQDDVPLLVSHFTERYAREMGRDVPRTDPAVLEVLSAYPWPGNIRELQNVIKRALTMAGGGVFSVEDLPDEVVAAAGDRPSARRGGFFDVREQHAAKFERDYLVDLLTKCRGDVSQAARDAQVPRGTLYRFLKKHELNPDEFRS